MPLDSPTPPRPAGGSGRVAAAIQKLKNRLGSLADVRAPGDAEEPILAPNVRVAVFQWMTEIRAADELAKAKVKPRRTALLFGPPGCGKTTLAHHLATRLGIPMVVVGAETLLGSYMGESERNVGNLFTGMEEAGVPAILFMDELEAIGGNRSQNTRGGADNARTSTLTVLLRRIEEFQGFAIAATNMPDMLDPALWRRFHIQITVDLPGYDERFAIIKRYSQPFEMQDDALAILADLTDGASPALLRGLMEGMKRGLILNPRLRLPIEKPEHVFVPIITALKPPPGIATPALWSNPSTIHAIAECGWPPEMPKE